MTFDQMMSGGAKIMDVLVYLSSKEGHQIQVRERLNYPVNYNMTTVAKMVFACFFIYMSQACPVSSTTKLGKFLLDLLPKTMTADYLVKNLSTFDMKNLDPSWIQHLDFTGLSTTAKNRLLLGTAGYRGPSAITYGIANAVWTDKHMCDKADFTRLALKAKAAQKILGTWLATGYFSCAAFAFNGEERLVAGYNVLGWGSRSARL
jgi:hypothetical protein